jgi:hypothetical protein
MRRKRAWMGHPAILLNSRYYENDGRNILEAQYRWEAMKPRTVMIVAAIFGGILPFRPFFFSSTNELATETIDLIISPAYILGRAFPPTGDVGSSAFFAVVILTNAILYGSVARYIYVRLLHSHQK